MKYLTFAQPVLILAFIFLVHPLAAQADITAGPADAPVCLTGTVGTSYLFSYQGDMPLPSGMGNKAEITFGGTSYYSTPYDGSQASIFVQGTYSWATAGTYWAYGIGPQYTSVTCWGGGPGGVGGCSGTGWPGSGTFTGPNGSGSGGPAWCKIVITSAPPPQPDLIAGSVTPTSAVTGSTVTLTATIANIGSGSTGASFTDLFQRATDAGGSNSTDIGTYANPTLASSGSNAATLSYAFPSAGTWYVRACADKSSAANTGTISESNENNCGTWTAVTVSDPALNGSCSVSPSSITAGGSATWSASASGGTGAYSYSWSGTDSLAGSGSSVTKTYAAAGTKTASVTITSGSQSKTIACSNNLAVNAAPIPPTGSCSVSPSSIYAGQSATWTVSPGGGNGTYTYSWSGTDSLSGSGSSVAKTYSTTGTKTASVVITSWGLNTTVNCSNSLSVGPAPAADLTAGAVTPTSATAGTAVTLSAPMSNIGNATSASFPTILQFDSGAVYTATQIAALAAGGSAPSSYSYTFSSAGTYNARFCANYTTSYTQPAAESNYGNDCGAWTVITVAAAPAADLTAGSVTPTSATAGSPVTLSATASNTGSATSGSFPILFQVQSPADLKNSAYLAAIAAGSSRSGSISYTFPSAGTYQVRACANYNTSWTAIVSESDYSNNCGAYTAITVAPPPPPPPPTCSLSANPATTVPSTLTWSSSGATSCTGTGFSTGGATAGSAGVTTSGSYLLSCSGSGGTCTDSAALSCTGATATINAAPVRIQAGDTSTVSYSASGADSCTITGPGAPGTVATAACTLAPASFTTPALTTQTTYTITCGAATDSVTINVVPKFENF